MRRWSHAHSLGTGGVIALLLATHLVWMLTLVFVLGILIGRSWHGLGKATGTVGAFGSAQAQLATERWKEVRARRSAHVARRAASREALERAYKLGVIEGMDTK